MGLIVDTGVFVQIERYKTAADLQQFLASEPLAISTVTASELLVGVHRATDARRALRQLIFDTILAFVEVHAFALDTARIHASLHAGLLAVGQRIGAHDLIIAATAMALRLPVLTTNRREFDRVPGLQVIEFPRPAETP